MNSLHVTQLWHRDLTAAESFAQKKIDRIYAQNLPSTVAGFALDPRPGERVVDLCACPGGKTTHAAQLMQNKGRLGCRVHTYVV